MLRCLTLLLMLPAVAFAQTPEVMAKVDAKLDAERAAQRNEDVEILRRLLNKAAGLPDKAEVLMASPASLIQRGTAVSSMGNRIISPVGPFDGVYLPGAGVVFTLHVPAGVPRTIHADRIGLNSSCNTCHQPQVHATQPVSVSLASCTTCHSDLPKGEPMLSEWDRVKQDVRGDKSKPVDKPKDDKPRAAMCEPGDLQSLVAGVLAANAKNVRHLGEKEGVTVVVTFDAVGAAVNVSPGPATDKTGFDPEEEKQLNLGNLHLKAGKYEAAAEAYSTALARFQHPFAVAYRADVNAIEAEQAVKDLTANVRGYYKSLATAYLQLDRLDDAKVALGKAQSFQVELATQQKQDSYPTGPAKLMLTVGKAEIDTAKDAAAFKKAVKAERLNFPK